MWLLSTSSFSNYLSDSSYIYLLLVAWTKKKKKKIALRATAYRAAAWTSVDIDFGPLRLRRAIFSHGDDGVVYILAKGFLISLDKEVVIGLHVPFVRRSSVE